jgi:HD-GYP domain-containing protein (c-di-GMP phosphodiesterase class II)
MKYIPADCIRPGQRLAEDLMKQDRRIFLRKDVILTAKLIKRINNLGIQGVFIADDFENLDMACIISNELIRHAKKNTQEFFDEIENEPKSFKRQIKKINNVTNDIVDQIISKQDIMNNILKIRSFDDYTYSHSLNVTMLSIYLGTLLGLKKQDLRHLALGGMIHDIGKIFIDKSILNKPGKLSFYEYELVKKHCQIGYDYISEHREILSPKSMEAVLSHHEHYNGDGYPRRLKGKDIPLFGRIICIADVYDALITDRPYRSALSPSDAIEYILAHYDTIFDPDITNVFLKKIAPYPIGTYVKLNNDVQGIVIQNFDSFGLRPKLRIVHTGKLTNQTIDLTHDLTALNKTIQKIL